MLDRVERRLAAILAADVVGYSRLIGENEGETLRRLRELRRSVVDPIIKQHQGRIVKTTGDGILIEFPSTVEAVRGDGVNVAARLEALSEAGGICISGRVYEDTVGRLEFPFEDRGEQQVKKIKHPVHVYSLGREIISSLPAQLILTAESSSGGLFSRDYAWLRANSSRALGLLLAAVAIIALGTWLLLQRNGSSEQQSASALRGPTVAVLPFENLTGDPKQAFFSKSISDRLITVLGRFAQLNVLSYNGKALDVTELGHKLHAQFIVEGSF